MSRTRRPPSIPHPIKTPIPPLPLKCDTHPAITRRLSLPSHYNITHAPPSRTHLSRDSHWPVKDAVHSQDGGLRGIDDRGPKERSKDAAVADGEGAAVHVFNRQLILASLQRKHAGVTKGASRINSSSDDVTAWIAPPPPNHGTQHFPRHAISTLQSRGVM